MKRKTKEGKLSINVEAKVKCPRFSECKQGEAGCSHAVAHAPDLSCEGECIWIGRRINIKCEEVK